VPLNLGRSRSSIGFILVKAILSFVGEYVCSSVFPIHALEHRGNECINFETEVAGLRLEKRQVRFAIDSEGSDLVPDVGTIKDLLYLC